jgi:predicted DNA-binding ribbon-helix-helix protein
MKSLVAKRSIVAAGHKTSVSLEDAFWQGLKEIARGRNITLSELVAAIDPTGATEICRQRFASSCSSFIATSLLIQRRAVTLRKGISR